MKDNGVSRFSLHPDMLAYASAVSANCFDPFVICYIGSDNRRIRRNTLIRATSRLLSLGWYSYQVTYKGHYTLYVTRVADHGRIAKQLVALASIKDSPLSANLYVVDGLGYSGPPWYGRVMYPLVDTVALDVHTLSSCKRSGHGERIKAYGQTHYALESLVARSKACEAARRHTLANTTAKDRERRAKELFAAHHAGPRQDDSRSVSGLVTTTTVQAYYLYKNLRESRISASKADTPTS